uniref:Uncharacterized protein n=1 Tax=Arundo donax TaxID=35708 RepID=A0A0A8Y113_ARUDO
MDLVQTLDCCCCSSCH